MFTLDELNLSLNVLAYQQAENAHKAEKAVNKAQLYPTLSNNIKGLKTIKAKAPKWFSKPMQTTLKTLVQSDLVVKANQFSEYWTGQIAHTALPEKTDLTPTQKYEKLIYQHGAKAGLNGGLDRATFEAMFPDVNLAESEDWLLSLDGSKVLRADDYYIGNYADFKAAHEEAIAKSEGALKEKLIKQFNAAETRLLKKDISKMDFAINDSTIPNSEKVKFLNQYMKPKDIDGEFVRVGEKIIFKYNDRYLNTNDKNRAYAVNRMAQYAGGTINFTSKISDETDPKRNAIILQEMAKFRRLANAQFTSWVQANDRLMAKIDERVNDPQGLMFKTVENGEPIEVEGINPSFSARPHQAAFVRQQAREMGGICGYDVGLGKAQPLDAKILTPDGWKTMGEMKIGSKVIAYDGSISNVVGVYPQGKKAIFEVRFSDGTSTKCCNEHLWLTQTEKDRKKERAARRQGKERIEKGSVKQLSEIRETLIYQTQKNHKIPLVKGIDFAPKSFAIDPYLMGVLLGDGCLRHKSVSITTPQKEIIARVGEIVQRDFAGKIYLSKHNDDSRTATFKLAKNPTEKTNSIQDQLKEYGLMECLSDSKFIPTEYLLGSIQQRLDLLHGLMDTDGYVSKDGITVQYYSTSETLANNVIELVQSLGGIAWKKAKKGSYKNDNGEKVECLDCFIVSIRMPSEINPFSLPRKAERVTPKSKYKPVRYIVDVVECGEQEAQCIAIDHPEHLYVTDHYIVTHNTFTALLSVQHLQSIGVKKKTIFVVPNSTFTNWKKECQAIYTPEVLARCLFVGLREDKNGNAKYQSNAVYEDLALILEHKHDKLFMTQEGFKAIALSTETIEEYFDFIAQNDTDKFIDPTNNKLIEKAKTQKAKFVGDLRKDMRGTLLEQMGVDSLVIDEAHHFKNGKNATLGAGRIKGLGEKGDTSARANDMLVKAWYIRKLNKANMGKSDGVLALTATPITNSPIEVYSMLSLAVGEDVLNKMSGCVGPREFLERFCDINTDRVQVLSGEMNDIECFTGLKNIEILRQIMGGTMQIKTADDLPNKEDMNIPDAEIIETPVNLTPELLDRLREMRTIYKMAKDKNGNHKEVAELAAEMGVSYQTLGHAFNFISRQTKAIVDQDLADEVSRYFFNEEQKAIAEKVVAEFNKKPFVEKGRTNTINCRADQIAKTYHSYNSDTGLETTTYDIEVTAEINDDVIVFNSSDFEAQSKFIKIAEKHGLNLDVSVSPKVAALLANVKAELANPLAKGGIAKQIIFTEELGIQNKIRQLLISKCGIAGSKIGIINGKTCNDNAVLQDYQDGFNADEKENIYQIIICNNKAEVGINLQKGTQAIHHLDIRWTPDSIQQRNGRGVRQGNYLAKQNIKVKVYFYDVNGTFDNYKRQVVDGKGNWIGQLMYGEGNKISFGEDALTPQQQAELAELIGDEDGQAKMEAKMTEILAENRKRKTIANREDVLILALQENVAKNALNGKLGSFEAYLDDVLTNYFDELETYVKGYVTPVESAQSDLTREEARLQHDEKGSPTYKSRQNTIKELKKELAKNEKELAKAYSVLQKQFKGIDPILENGDPMGFSRNYVLTGKYDLLQSNKAQGEKHPLYENFESDRNVKLKQVQNTRKKLDDKNVDLGIDEARIKAYVENQDFNIDGLPLIKGDILKHKKDGIIFVVNDCRSYWVNGYQAFAGGNWDFKQADIDVSKLEEWELIPSDSAQAVSYLPELAKVDEQRGQMDYADLIPAVAGFYGKDYRISLNGKTGIMKEENGFNVIGSYSDLQWLAGADKSLYERAVKDYEKMGIFINEEQKRLERSASFNMNKLSHFDWFFELEVLAMMIQNGIKVSKQFVENMRWRLDGKFDPVKLPYNLKPYYSRLLSATDREQLHQIANEILAEWGVIEEGVSILQIMNSRILPRIVNFKDANNALSQLSILISAASYGSDVKEMLTEWLRD